MIVDGFDHIDSHTYSIVLSLRFNFVVADPLCFVIHVDTVDGGNRPDLADCFECSAGFVCHVY